MHESGALRENQEDLRHSAEQVNSSVDQASADQLAATIAGAEGSLRSLPELRSALARALSRCPRTSAVLDALRLLADAAAGAPPPPPWTPVPARITPARTDAVTGEDTAAIESSRTDERRTAPGSGGTADARSDPWTAFSVTHAIGDIVYGRVTGTQVYGAFVNLEQGISGLLHSSEIPNKQGRQVADVFRAGQRVAVKIIKMDAAQQRINLSMIDVPQDLPATDDTHQQADDGSDETQSKRDRAARSFLEAVREFLVERDGTPRPLLREMARIRGGRMYSALEDPNPKRAREIASALIAALAGWALTRPLTKAQLKIIRLADDSLGDRQSTALINGLTWASSEAMVPTPAQVSEALADAGPNRPEVRDLVVCSLIRALNRAIGDEDVTKASRVVDVAVELGADLPQSKAGELVDLLSSMKLPSTTSLKFADLRDRADPENRPDLAAITDQEDRSTLLGALAMLQAQIAVEVARKNRDELLAQALMWLAQQLGDTIKHWMPPRTPHPAVVLFERKLSDWRRQQRQPQRARRNFTERPTGLRQEVVQRAVAGEAAAARQAAQALESFLRTGDAAAEEWDAFLAASLGTSLNEAALTWRKIKNPSPEVSWNLAMFEATQPFTRHLAWRPLEQALLTYQSNPLTALHALYHAIKTLQDSSASAEAQRASHEFVIQRGPDVPDGRLLLASLSLMDVETEEGYNKALQTFSQWQLLGDPPPLLPAIGRRTTAETRQQIQELRRDNRYSRRWVMLILCGSASGTAQQGVAVACLNAASEVAEQLGETAIARSAHERAVEIALDQHSHPRAGTEQAVRRTFESTCIAALTFSRKTGDQRLARHVRSAMQEAGGTWNDKANELLTELLGARKPEATRPLPVINPSVPVPPALAELAQSFNAAQKPADIVALKPRMMSALAIVDLPEETVRQVSEVMTCFDRLSGGVGMHEARDLLQEIADQAQELNTQHGRAGDNSLTAMLKAVERARVFAADQIEDAPAPAVDVAPGWCGLAMEADRPQLVLKVTAPPHDAMTNVAIAAGADLVQLGTLAAGEERTVAVYADVIRDGDLASASLTVTWTWGMVADRNRTTQLTVPVISWGGVLGDAGLPGLAIPNRFVVGEPLVGGQLSSGLFQGRHDHLEHIESAYGSGLPAQPTCFHGIRKVGKSSLLNRVVRQLQESGRVVLTITAQGLQPSVQDQEAIVANICRRMVRSNPGLFSHAEVPSRVENGVAFLEDFFEVFARSAAAISTLSPILVIDEFHCLYRAEVAGLLDVFRMLAEERRVGFVFAATEGPSGLPSEASLMLTPRRVDFLTEPEVSALVDAVFAETPMVVPADVRRQLFDASAGHPNFTTAIARRALDAANDGRRNVLCANDIGLASAEISSTRSEMFEQSWFAPDILADRDRAAAIDLAFTAKQPRGWMDLRDVTTRLGEGGKGILFRLTSAYVLESSETGGVRTVRIRGGVLESYLRQQHGMTLSPSPDSTRVSVGIFLDVENLIRGATTPEELVDRVERFGNRFGSVQVRFTAATQGALVRAGWQPNRVEAAFNAAGWQFRSPPAALAGKASIADNVLSPIIVQAAEQFNLAEIILGSGDYSFIPVAQVLIGDGGPEMSASGRRVHALSLKFNKDTDHSPRNPEWESLARRRFNVCQVLAEERPDLVLWDLENILADPEGAAPASPLGWAPR
jgi:predicted RNA-binding protein with RPS1 domain